MAELAEMYLNPKDVFVNVQGIQNVLPFGVLHDALDLPVISIQKQRRPTDISGYVWFPA